MPVVRDRSESPRRRNVSRSPDPDVPGNQAGPSTKKPRTTTVDIQKRRLENLFAHPERDPLPQEPVAPKERQFKQNLEIITNLTASAAAAGSGEFHVYKHGRRKEYERIRQMELKSKELEEQAAFQARQAERDAVTDAKTAKNRAKRQKRKNGKKGGGADNGNTNGEAGEANGAGTKRKLAGGAGVKFKKPGEGSDDEDEAGDGVAEEEQEEKTDQGQLNIPVPSAPTPVEAPPMKVEEREIIIHDDE